MPIHDVGYRTWRGAVRGQFSRLIAIASTGIKISFKSQWIRRMLFASWLPVLYVAFWFFMFEKFMDERAQQALQLSGARTKAIISKAVTRAQEELKEKEQPIYVPSELRNFLRAFPKSDVALDALAKEPGRARHIVWNWFFMFFFSRTQGPLMLIMVGLIVPPLISRDLRSRAYLMYFSRPIGRWEYVLGKLAIPAVFLSLITILPGLSLYVFGVMLSPGFSVVADTWDIPFRIVAASAVLIIPTSLLALMYSSLTYESRFAAFAWVATWILGEGAYYAVSFAQLDPEKLPEGGPFAALKEEWSFLSIYAMVRRVQEWIFGLGSTDSSIGLYVILLTAIVAGALIILYRRISAPINA